MVKILEMAHNWSTWLKVRNGPKQPKTLIGQMTQFSKLPNFHESKRTQIWKSTKGVQSSY